MDLNEAYRILGIRPGATEAEAKAAYKEQVRLWHPDRYSEGSSLRAVAEANMRQANLAYETVIPDLVQENARRPKPRKAARSRPEADPAAYSNPTYRRLRTLSDRVLDSVNPLLERLNFGPLIAWIRENRPSHRPPWYRYHGANKKTSENEHRNFSFESMLNDALGRAPKELHRSPRPRKNQSPLHNPKDRSDRIEPVEPVGRVEGVKGCRGRD